MYYIKYVYNLLHGPDDHKFCGRLLGEGSLGWDWLLELNLLP